MFIVSNSSAYCTPNITLLWTNKSDSHSQLCLDVTEPYDSKNTCKILTTKFHVIHVIREDSVM